MGSLTASIAPSYIYCFYRGGIDLVSGTFHGKLLLELTIMLRRQTRVLRHQHFLWRLKKEATRTSPHLVTEELGRMNVQVRRIDVREDGRPRTDLDKNPRVC